MAAGGGPKLAETRPSHEHRNGIVSLSILSIAYPFAEVTAEPVGGAERMLWCLDRALVGAGHRSRVIALEGSRVHGELLALPAAPGLIDAHARVGARRRTP